MPKPVNPNSKKILCVCRGGASRSVGLSNVLKWVHGHDSLPIGFEGNSPETLDFMCNWAEVIVVMHTDFAKEIPEKYQDKVKICDVGRDVYFSPNKMLYTKCDTWAKENDLNLNDNNLIQLWLSK